MPNTVNYYLSKGFDRKTAEYYARGRRQIKQVTPNRDYTLTILFDNGELRRYDMQPLLQPNTVFEPLLDWNNFQRVYLDEDAAVAWDIDPNVDSNVIWNNKIDLCPDTCYIDSVPID